MTSLLTNSPIEFSPIGVVHSPYKEKFAIPRQPGLVTAAKGSIEFNHDLPANEMIDGLANFSHIWVIFVFHQTQEFGWKAKVKPPRLGGNQKIGVLATRSTFRPNAIGMSAIKLDSIETGSTTRLHVSGLDLLDNTPILDIKPYIPYSDTVVNSTAGFAETAPTADNIVEFSEQACHFIEQQRKSVAELQQVIEQVLQQDPRPAYRQGKPDEKTYGMALFDFNIRFRFTSLHKICVEAIDMNTNQTHTI